MKKWKITIVVAGVIAVGAFVFYLSRTAQARCKSRMVFHGRVRGKNRLDAGDARNGGRKTESPTSPGR